MLAINIFDSRCKRLMKIHFFLLKIYTSFSIYLVTSTRALKI